MIRLKKIAAAVIFAFILAAASNSDSGSYRKPIPIVQYLEAPPRYMRRKPLVKYTPVYE